MRFYTGQPLYCCGVAPFGQSSISGAGQFGSWIPVGGCNGVIPAGQRAREPSRKRD